MKRIIMIVSVLVLLICAFTGCYSKTDAGSLHITFTVTHGDGTQKAFEFDTDMATLADVLIENGLVRESVQSSGLYDVVDDELADWNDNEAWWCFSCNGEMLTVGIEETELVEGAEYEAVLLHGFG